MVATDNAGLAESQAPSVRLAGRRRMLLEPLLCVRRLLWGGVDHNGAG
jgi:hypothetical protein